MLGDTFSNDFRNRPAVVVGNNKNIVISSEQTETFQARNKEELRKSLMYPHKSIVKVSFRGRVEPRIWKRIAKITVICSRKFIVPANRFRAVLSKYLRRRRHILNERLSPSSGTLLLLKWWLLWVFFPLSPSLTQLLIHRPPLETRPRRLFSIYTYKSPLYSEPPPAEPSPFPASRLHANYTVRTSRTLSVPHPYIPPP